MNVETIIAQYQPILRAFLGSRMSSRADADDVLQDTLTKVLRSLHTLEADDKIEPWLFQIANNALMDYYRRRRREKNVRPEDLWFDNLGSSVEHPFEGCVEPFLDSLPNEAGDLLREIELRGVSQKEYAKRLGVSYSTLKSRVQASRKQLRKRFVECCDIAFASDGSVLDYTRKSQTCDICR